MLFSFYYAPFSDDELEDLGGYNPWNPRKNFHCSKEQFAVRFKELVDVLPKDTYDWSIELDQEGVLGLSMPASTARRLGKRIEKILGPEIT